MRYSTQCVFRGVFGDEYPVFAYPVSIENERYKRGIALNANIVGRIHKDDIVGLSG